MCSPQQLILLDIASSYAFGISCVNYFSKTNVHVFEFHADSDPSSYSAFLKFTPLSQFGVSE